MKIPHGNDAPTDGLRPQPLSRRRWRLRRPVFLGSVRRTTPLSDRWGFDRGTPIDRFYIERFLERHRSDIHGCVLEVKDSVYTERFATAVARKDVLDIDGDNDRATIVADLAGHRSIKPDTFDCFILTQTLQYISDLNQAIENSRNLLRSGGVLLVTVPAITRSGGRDEPVDLWRFTAAGCAALFGRVFGGEAVTVTPYGNVLAAIAFLTGLAQEELMTRELEVNDPRFPVIVTVRAVRR